MLSMLCDISSAVFAKSCKDLKTLLLEDEENGSRLAIIFAQIALFIATIFAWNSKLCAEHDSTGFSTALSYQIMAVLVSNSRRLIPLSCLRFIHRHSGFKVNSAANFIGFMLALFLEKFYEKSLSSLGFALSITVLFLILLVIIRPSTDVGLFSLLIGVIGSVAYNLFGLKFQSWIVGAICLPLFAFRLWLENNWLKVPTPDGSTRGTKQICKSETIEETIEQLAVGLFHLFWVYNLFITNRQSCTSSSIIMGVPACLLIFNLWFGIALIPRVYCLFKTGPAAPSRREDRRDPEEDPESDLEALSRREERTDPEALSRREERTVTESLARWAERMDRESLSRREENQRTEAGAGDFKVGRRAGASNVGEAAGAFNEGEAAGAFNVPLPPVSKFVPPPPTGNINLGLGAGGYNLGEKTPAIVTSDPEIVPALPTGNTNLGLGAGAYNLGERTPAIITSGPEIVPQPPTGNINLGLGPGAGGLRKRKEGAIKISTGPDAGSRGVGSGAINIGQGSGGHGKRTQVDKEDRPADVAM